MEQKSFRAVIVTTKADVFQAIRVALSREPYAEMIINVPGLTEVENKLSLSKSNVLIVDTDGVSHNGMLLSQMIKKYGVKVLLVGANSTSAIRLMKFGVRDFVVKPLQSSALPSFAESVIVKIRAFVGISSNASSLVSTVSSNNSGIVPSVPTANMSRPAAAAAAAAANVSHPAVRAASSTGLSPAAINSILLGGVVNNKALLAAVDTNQTIITIGSSTGGTEALEKIFRALPADCPPILVVQHMPSGFTKLFADRLNGLCKPSIKEAESGDLLRKGLVLIAPGDYHMILEKSGPYLSVKCYKGVKVHGVMPAVDILFETVAQIMKSNAVGVILTGMGSDGAKGMLLMHNQGAKTIGQDKNTCVVYGMPKVAFDLGAVDYQLPIDGIAGKMLLLAR